MNVVYCGTDFSHNKGEFCHKSISQYYFISCFSTPFLYEKDGNLLQGFPGDIMIISPGEIIWHGPQNKDESFVNDWMHVSGEDMKYLLEKYPLPLNTTFHVDAPHILRNCIKRATEESLLKHPGYEDIICSSITETIILLHRLYQAQTSDDAPVHRIASAKEAVFRNLEKDWTIQEMADLCDYSVSRFCALYYQQYGLSPKADLLLLRLEHAKQLLLYSGLSITEISERCGFKSIYYFSKYFKAKEGCSPRKYVQNNQTNHDTLTSP